MVGLNGAGKTTSSAKLANWLKKQGRAAAAHRLRFAPPGGDRAARHARPADRRARFHAAAGEKDVLRVGQGGARVGRRSRRGNVQIYDTAGRQEIDEPLDRRSSSGCANSSQPQEVLLVADAATGQQAVSVATHFHEALDITGLVLTKLDGDARGGAALSMREVTQRPIKFAGVGEKLDQFEPFYPDRLAGRILGMGDIVCLVEKAAAAIDEDEAQRMEEKMRTASLRPERLPRAVQNDAETGAAGKYPWHAARNGQSEGLFG